MTTTQATITEHGNGLPSIGEHVYHADTDTVYLVTGYPHGGQISTNGPGCGNSLVATLEEVGSASDMSDEEWEAIESANYGVTV